MPFTPKFVDLVKNNITTVGTGPVTLGTAVTGFSSFAGACQAGDQFYYCIQGVDKPAEREVGRGTMQSDGKIAREPIAGPATNFTTGTKTIALVASAEWMGQVQAAMAGGGAAGLGDKLFVELSGAAVPTSQKVVMSAGYADQGIGCARYIQDSAVNAAYVAAHPRLSFLAADGRGFRLDEQQRLTVEMAGGRANYAGAGNRGVDNLAAALALLEWTPDAARNVSPTVHFGIGSYWFSATLEPRVMHHAKGVLGMRNAGAPGGVGTRFVFPKDVTCYRVHSGNTTGATGSVGNNVGSAAKSILEDVLLEQEDSHLGVSPSAYGVHARGTFYLRNVSIISSGDGIHGNITTGAGGAEEGECSEWKIDGCIVISHLGHGLYLNGGNVSAGSSRGLVIQGANKCGIYDNAWFTNSHVSPQLSGWGNSGAYHDGFRWMLLVENDTGTPPGSNDEVWYKLAAASAASAKYPQWSATVTYYAASPFIAPGATIVDPYVEAVGGNVSMAKIVVGGNAALTERCASATSNPEGALSSRSGVGFLRSSGGDSNWPGMATLGTIESGGLGIHDGANGLYGRRQLLSYANAYESLSWRWENNVDLSFSLAGRIAHTVTGQQSTATFGRPDAQKGIFTVRGAYALAPSLNGGNDGYMAYARIHYGVVNGVPDQGGHAVREFAWNLDSSVTGVVGWSCVVAGTPGKHYPLTLFSPVAATSATSHTFGFADGGGYRRFTAATAVSVTVPDESAEPLPVGSQIEFEQGGAGVVTVSPAPGVTINSRGNKMATAGQYAVALLKKVGANSWVLTGDLA